MSEFLMRISFIARRIIFNVHFPENAHTQNACQYFIHTQTHTQRQQHQNIAININEEVAHACVG